MTASYLYLPETTTWGLDEDFTLMNIEGYLNINNQLAVIDLLMNDQ